MEKRFPAPHALKPPVFVDVEFLYGARADIFLLNGRVAGMLPGFPEHEMRGHTVPLQIIEDQRADVQSDCRFGDRHLS
jgi:hypothetical protein